MGPIENWTGMTGDEKQEFRYVVVGFPVHKVLTTDRVEIMEFTGLHDKKGIEIYEGDILNSLYSFEGCKGVYEVVWIDGRFHPRRRGVHQQMGVTITMSDLSRCEVIGNIYDNPELCPKK